MPGRQRVQYISSVRIDLFIGYQNQWDDQSDGQRLYVGVGSNSNIAKNSMDVEYMRAAILEVDPATGATQVFASGLLVADDVGNTIWRVAPVCDQSDPNLIMCQPDLCDWQHRMQSGSGLRHPETASTNHSAGPG